MELRNFRERMIGSFRFEVHRQPQESVAKSSCYQLVNAAAVYTKYSKDTILAGMLSL